MTSSAATAGLAGMLVLTVAVGVYARRFANTTSDFMVAARAVPPGLNAAAISGEYLSAASFLGVAGLVMKFGWDVLWYPVGYAAGYLVLLIFIAGPLRRFGAYTIPDFAEGRFDSPRFRRLAVCLVLVIGLFYTLPQMKAAGITVASAIGAPYGVGVILIAAVVVLIVVSGGMRGITLVQAMQFAVKLFAISLPIFFILAELGGPSRLFGQSEADSAPRVARATTVAVQPGQAWDLPDGVRVHLDHAARARLDAEGGRVVRLDGDQALPAGRLEWVDQARVGLAAGSAVPYAPGTPAVSNRRWLAPFGPLTGAGDHPLLFTYSLIIAIVFGTMGLPHILVRFYTNPDGGAARRTAWMTLCLVSAFYLFPPLYGLAGRLHAPVLYSSSLTDAVVLYVPRLLAPGWTGELLGAIVAAGAFAAFTSTLSGLLVSLAGALGHDIWGRWLRPASSTTGRGRAFRAAALLAGASAALLGLLVERFDISVLVGWAFAIAASSFFPLLVLGIWWRGLTTAAAATGTAVGGLAATLAIVTTMLAQAGGPLGAFLQANTALAVVLAQPAIVTIPVAFAVMVGMSLARPRLPAGVATKMLQLHVPDRLGLRRDYVPD